MDPPQAPKSPPKKKKRRGDYNKLPVAHDFKQVSDMDPSQAPKPPPPENKCRMLRHLADYNGLPIAKNPPSPSVSSSLDGNEDASTVTTETTRSGRPIVPVVPYLDSTDGSKMEESSSRKHQTRSHSYHPGTKAIKIGDKLCVKWEIDGGKWEHFTGTVGKGPAIDPGSNTTQYIIQYEDGEEHEMEKTEVQKLIQFESARRQLCRKIGVSRKEVLAALEKMEPPYGLNQAMKLIHKAKQDPRAMEDAGEQYRKFAPVVGLEIQRHFDGKSYNGKVVSGPEIRSDNETGDRFKTWRVEYEDEDKEDLTYDELFRWRANRPSRPHPSVGRQLFFLELFAGQGIVTQKMAELKFRVQSIDNNPDSAATIIKDIMEVRFEDFGGVPDVLWASPPCSTYSRLTGTIHRNPKEGKYEISDDAHLHNHFLPQLRVIIEWMMRKHPHLIVVIENPEAYLREMPLMKEMERQLSLQKTTVHYCAFGAMEKKPTNLWTNDPNLRLWLSEFKCSTEKCPYNKLGNEHPRGARGNKCNYNTALVPPCLADLVATYAFSKLNLDMVPRKEAAVVSEEDKQVLNQKLERVA